MKTITLCLSIALLCSLGMFGQENKTIKEETTVKRVVKKEGSQVIVKEVESVEKEKGAVIVADDENENQFFSEKSKNLDEENVLVDEVKVDAANEAMIEANKKKQEEELLKSQEEAKAKAEEQRKILEAQQQERLKMMEENRKKLMKRGKGTGKLRKKKDN